MADYPINPVGWNGQPVVLAHLSLEHTHPENPRLHLAACAPIWFDPSLDPPAMYPIIACPGCMTIMRKGSQGMTVSVEKTKKG